MSQTTPTFNKWRAFFWPIKRQELPKFLPMLFFFFLISINYHLLRIAKDVFVVTAPKGGAETIAYLKVWAILPSAFFFTYLYTKLSNKFNREKIFYVIGCVFFIFFLIFAFILYPNKDKLFFDSFANQLQQILPKGFSGLISIIRYWIYSIFYIMAEAWSTIMLTVLAWGFANDVVKIKEAKRFYALFGIGINSAGIFAGSLSNKISAHLDSTTFTLNPLTKFLGAKNGWDQTVIYLMAIILSIIVISMIIYRYLHVKYFSNRASFVTFLDENNSKKRRKMSLSQNIKYILKSKYLISIACIVLCYNIFMNLSEILWKSQMRELFTTPGKYAIMMSKITFYTGVFATLSSYLFTGSFIRRFGWKKTALLTPIIEVITGFGFYYFLLNKYFSSTNTHLLGLSPLALCVFFGALQNIFSRCAKYTVYDASKEMAYIPLSDEEKLKGKSAIDGIGSRLGKSGSSLTLQILIIIFGSTIACSPVVFPVIVFILPVWFLSVNHIGKKFSAQEEEKNLVKALNE